MKKKIFSIILLIVVMMPFMIVKADTYQNITTGSLRSCGDGLMTNIPSLMPKVISIIYTIIQVAVPVVLVIMGSLDLFKGISAQKEDEIKKGQQLFIKRLIAAAIVFFVFAIVKVVISLVANDSDDNKAEKARSERILECVECFIENDCD